MDQPPPVTASFPPDHDPTTIGGMIYEVGPDGENTLIPTGHKMRGTNEMFVIERMRIRRAIRDYYGSGGECVGMGC